MSQFRKPYPIPDPVKDAVYRAIAIAERGVRRVAGTHAAVDKASLSSLRNFVLPQFQASLGCTVHSTSRSIA